MAGKVTARKVVTGQIEHAHKAQKIKKKASKEVKQLSARIEGIIGPIIEKVRKPPVYSTKKPQISKEVSKTVKNKLSM